jgi:hypothetical protein
MKEKNRERKEEKGMCNREEDGCASTARRLLKCAW